VKVEFLGRHVRVESNGDYREIWLTRPEARNALDVVMRDELFSVLTALAADTSVQRIGLLGEGADFCSGGDLQEFGTAKDTAAAWAIRVARSLPVLFIELAPRLVVGVHGAAVGAGIELAAFAHRVLASADARFRLPELAMGLLPGSGGTVSIATRIGPHRTLEMLLTGRWIGSEEAKRIGLVDELVGRDRLTAAVREAAAQ
jgi:enoyl-CoA hydratase/carnithine racemase